MKLGRERWENKRKRSRGISCGFECIWILKLRHIGGRKKYVEEKKKKKVEIFDLSIYIFDYHYNNNLLFVIYI